MTYTNSDGSITTSMEKHMNRLIKHPRLCPWYVGATLWGAYLLAMYLSGCSLVNVQESVSTGTVTITYPQGKFDDGSNYMGLPAPPDCAMYAHDAPKPDHIKWADCMGVGYK